MEKISAGILLYKYENGELLFFLIHPGGPFLKNKSDGWWSIPKGEPDGDEPLLATALREFEEETGFKPCGEFIALSVIIQKGGKKVYCWACEGDLDAQKVVSNTFEMEWPPKSGEFKTFAEVDQAGWFNLEDAKVRINGRQFALLEELTKLLRRFVICE